MPDSIEREIRFAVVIYGGVSLAVYINGVVQELFHLVRSTADDVAAPLTEVEKVYRKLACIVGAGAPDRRDCKEGDPDDAVQLHYQLQPRADIPGAFTAETDPQYANPRTRFVVDVLSGTSAGGINAIYLAKALVCNRSLDELARMWIDVADIEKLLNDRKSVEYPLKPQHPPRSLLNSRWMYKKLLEAVDRMDTETENHLGNSPMVEDLDLFCTATDLDGVPVTMALADRTVKERRHRNVFHFRHRPNGDRNDFKTDINPFLAFAARCTSAFPFAFEPMALCDIFDVIRFKKPHEGQSYCQSDTDKWQDFYLDYIREGDRLQQTPFRFRAFGDGGYLDNKPFSYAIDTVKLRHAELPVDRKLLYIEPSPDDLTGGAGQRSGPDDRPDAIENSLAALIDLPRYETIRQDLTTILEWNANIRRLKRVMASVTFGSDTPLPDPGTAAKAFYRRLRLSAVTDVLASRVAEGLDLDPKSARCDAIRALAGQWRLEHHKDESAQEAFLRTYDSDYLQRAVRYLRKVLRQSPPQETTLRTKLKDGLTQAHKDLRRLAECDMGHVGKLSDLPSAIDLERDELERHLEVVLDPTAAAKWRGDHPGLPETAFKTTAAALAERVAYLLKQRRWDARITQVHDNLSAFFAPKLEAVRESLQPAFDAYGGENRFMAYDCLLFPVTFGTALGEVDPIDVIRVSPDDVTEIAGVQRARSVGDPKLKGQTYGAFGGFLDKRWREHDMLLGRLHGAERLITAILPDSDSETVTVRESLIREAQEAIACEWARTQNASNAEEAEDAAAISS